VWGLLTRAEEVGLLGAFEAIRLGTVPHGAVVLSLECSKALPEAPQGSGVIVRVGDRLSVFDPAVTAALAGVAAGAQVPHARRLMDGGVCEASAFCAAGYRASGLCIALGNYHNADDGGFGVAPEHVLVDDYLAEVDLLVRLTTDPLDLDAQGAWLVERTERARAALGAGHA
jgi:endoglucanase